MLGCISIGSQVLGRCWHCEVPKHGEVPKQPWFGCSNAWLKVSLLEGAFVGKSIGSKASNPKEISPILHKFPHSNSHELGYSWVKTHKNTENGCNAASHAASWCPPPTLMVGVRCLRTARAGLLISWDPGPRPWSRNKLNHDFICCCYCS